MKDKSKEVPYPGCACCNQTEVKETSLLLQLHRPSLPRMHLFKDITESLQKWIKVQNIEPTMSEILCWYIKLKGHKICQDFPHLQMEIASAAKSQNYIVG